MEINYDVEPTEPKFTPAYTLGSQGDGQFHCLGCKDHYHPFRPEDPNRHVPAPLKKGTDIALVAAEMYRVFGIASNQIIDKEKLERDYYSSGYNIEQIENMKALIKACHLDPNEFNIMLPKGYGLMVAISKEHVAFLAPRKVSVLDNAKD